MNAISESWSCPNCGAQLTSTPPVHRLCDGCLEVVPIIQPPGLPSARGRRQ